MNETKYCCDNLLDAYLDAQQVISDAWLENRRLRDLVRRAYVEGFSDGGMAAHPLGPQSSDVWDWETSEAKQELGDDKNATI
jgi:hypothetical protein